MIRDFFATLKAAWQFAKWLRKQKKDMEANATAYLSDDRAFRWRLEAEKFFRALEKGNVKVLPKWCRWFFRHTKADDRFGWFGLRLLKSKKIYEGDPVLDERLEGML